MNKILSSFIFLIIMATMLTACSEGNQELGEKVTKNRVENKKEKTNEINQNKEQSVGYTYKDVFDFRLFAKQENDMFQYRLEGDYLKRDNSIKSLKIYMKADTWTKEFNSLNLKKLKDELGKWGPFKEKHSNIDIIFEYEDDTGKHSFELHFEPIQY